MRNHNTDEVDDFLEKVDETTQQINDILSGKLDLNEQMELMKDKDRLVKYKEDQKKNEQQERLLRGRKGKGEKEGYLSFCRFCHHEFMIHVDPCTHCGNETQTYEERYAVLKEKLEVYKIDKKNKMERKLKWENWVKTQAMMYKKTSTNYKKWEFFDSGSDTEEEDKAPIVPNDDPNFKAMEQDFADRAKRRKRDLKESNILKDRGNECLKKGLYKTAEQFYTDALDLRKDNKPLYTNRALTRIKRGDWEGAIADTTRVLDYCECFEDGWERSADICSKALYRRAIAYRGQRDYKNALTDLVEAAKLNDNKDIERMTKATNEDIVQEALITKIMENQHLLGDKEYIETMCELMSGKGVQAEGDEEDKAG